MEIFIDLAKLTEGATEPTIPGIDLNLAGLVDFNKVEVSPDLTQNQLRTESELTMPAFNPTEYFDKIQQEFNKIKSAQESFSLKDDVKTFQEAQVNASTALDPFAAYLESRFEKISNITSDNTEIRQLIQGVSDNLMGDIPNTINNPLKQTVALEMETSVNTINQTLSSLVDTLAEAGVDTDAKGIGLLAKAKTKELVNQQEVTINNNTSELTQLSETISNFATNLLNGESTKPGESAGGTAGQSLTTSLEEAKRNQLPITKETAKPDFSAASLSALQQMAESNQLLASSPNILNTATTQYNNTMASPVTQTGTPTQPGTEQPQPNQVIMNNGSQDNSSMYIMQMLNLMKSGQLKVKLN